MLTRVDVLNARGGTLQLPLSVSGPGYVISDIEGLGPVKAALTSASMAQMDGAQLQSARRDTRNITAKIGFQPDYMANTVESLRQQLYQYLLPKSNVKLTFFKDGTAYAVTNATVEDLDDSRFQQNPEMDLSVLCYDPDFYAPVGLTANGLTTGTTATISIPYGGSSDAGMIFTLHVTTALSGFTLYNTRPDGTTQTFAMSSLSLVSGDTVTVNTIPGQKAVTLTRSGIVSSLLYGKDPASAWPSLGNGANLFRCVAALTGMTYTVQYVTKYAGL